MNILHKLFAPQQPTSLCDVSCRADEIRQRALDAAFLSGRPRL